jgi:hypothetical protein
MILPHNLPNQHKKKCSRDRRNDREYAECIFICVPASRTIYRRGAGPAISKIKNYTLYDVDAVLFFTFDPKNTTEPGLKEKFQIPRTISFANLSVTAVKSNFSTTNFLAFNRNFAAL